MIIIHRESLDRICRPGSIPARFSAMNDRPLEWNFLCWECRTLLLPFHITPACFVPLATYISWLNLLITNPFVVNELRQKCRDEHTSVNSWARLHFESLNCRWYDLREQTYLRHGTIITLCLLTPQLTTLGIVAFAA